MEDMNAILMLEQYREGLLEIISTGGKRSYAPLEEKEVWLYITDHDIARITYEIVKIEAVLSYCKTIFKNQENSE